MKRWSAVLLRALAACAPPGAASTPPSGNTVLLISLDGFPAWMFEDPRLPAPTVAALLGLTLEGVDGKAVSAVLD